MPQTHIQAYTAYAWGLFWNGTTMWLGGSANNCYILIFRFWHVFCIRHRNFWWTRVWGKGFVRSRLWCSELIDTFLYNECMETERNNWKTIKLKKGWTLLQREISQWQWLFKMKKSKTVKQNGVSLDARKIKLYRSFPIETSILLILKPQKWVFFLQVLEPGNLISTDKEIPEMD